MPKPTTKENLIKAGATAVIFFIISALALVVGIGGALQTSLVFSGAMGVVAFVSSLISMAITRGKK